MELFEWLLSATAGESRGVVNYGRLRWPSLPARCSGEDSGWEQAVNGFRNTSADCYIICAVQMLGASRILRHAILKDIEHVANDSILRALRRDLTRSFTCHAPVCHVATQCPIMGFRRGCEGDPHEVITKLLAAWGLASRTGERAHVKDPVTTSDHLFCGSVVERRRGCTSCLDVVAIFEQRLCFFISSDVSSVAAGVSRYGVPMFAAGVSVCRRCGQEGAIAEVEVLRRLPRFLFVQLGIYDMDVADCPKRPGLSIASPLDLEVPSATGVGRYRLIAAIEHIGPNLNGGHCVHYRVLVDGSVRVANDSGHATLGPRHASFFVLG